MVTVRAAPFESQISASRDSHSTVLGETTSQISAGKNMSIFKEPQKVKRNYKLDDDQKRNLLDSKTFIMIASGVVCFLIGGGYRLILPGAIAEQFHDASSFSSQATAFLQFSMFFGFIPALGGFILSAALIDYVSHSKGNR